MNKERFPIAIAAGSWDHFHVGHKQFLLKAFSVAREVWVGVTAPELTEHKPLAATIESFAIRQKSVQQFVQNLGKTHLLNFFRLEDIFGPAIEPTITGALLVTTQTTKGGEAVNDKRRALGLAPLQLIKVPFFMAGDGKLLSSERIRRGEVNRNGLVYRSLFTRYPSLLLPKKLRTRLRRPFGELVENADFGKRARKILTNQQSTPLISVGDIVTELLARQKMAMDVAVIDLFVERKKMFAAPTALGLSSQMALTPATNKAGEVSGVLAQVIREVMEKALADTPQVVLVEGEEDLAVLPVVLEAPLGALVMYGQPGDGVVVVEVTEEKKQEAYELLSAFEPRGKV